MNNKNIQSEFYVNGMHCAACELVIEKKLAKVNGITKVNAKLANSKVYIESEKELNAEELSDILEGDGYTISAEKKNNKIEWKELGIAAMIAGFVVLIFILIQKLGIGDYNNPDQTSLWVVFLMGIFASISTCMAAVGGLVLSISSNYAKAGNKIKPLIQFHVSRLIGFFVLGGIIGIIGSAIVLNSTTTFILNLILFVVMLLMAFNLLDLFTYTRKYQIKLPKTIGTNIFKLEMSKNSLAPILLGVATFVIPCGYTQSMQLYSLTKGSFLEGAVVMLVFALGTFPVLALISLQSIKFSKTLQSGIFFKTAGFIVLFFAILNFTSSLATMGYIDPIIKL